MILLCLPMTDLSVSDLFHGKTVRISSSFDLSFVKLVAIVELITLVAHCMDLKSSWELSKDVFFLLKYSRFVLKSGLCFSLQYFFVFIGSMIIYYYFFFLKKMLYHLMVLVAPVILCFISKSYFIVPFFESLDGIGYLSSIEVFFFLFN